MTTPKMITQHFPPLCLIGCAEDEDAILLTKGKDQLLIQPVTQRNRHFIRVLSAPSTNELTWCLDGKDLIESALVESFPDWCIRPGDEVKLTKFGFIRFLHTNAIVSNK